MGWEKGMHKGMFMGGRVLLLAGLASTSFGSTAVADLEDGKMQFEFQHGVYLGNSSDFGWVTNLAVEVFSDPGALEISNGSGPIDAGVGDYFGTDLFEFDRIILTDSERSPTEYLVFDVLQGHGDVRIESLTGIDW
jgi:hypothetical protein